MTQHGDLMRKAFENRLEMTICLGKTCDIFDPFDLFGCKHLINRMLMTQHGDLMRKVFARERERDDIFGGGNKTSCPDVGHLGSSFTRKLPNMQINCSIYNINN